MVLTIGTALSLIATVQCFNLAGFSLDGDPKFALAGFSSLPSSVALFVAVCLRDNRRRLGFIVGILGAIAGLASAVYQSARLTNMETAYLCYGLVLGACYLGVRFLDRIASDTLR